MILSPGVNVVTVPSVVVEVVSVVVMPGSLVVVFSVVVVLVCAKANGAINAHVRLRIVRFIMFLSFVCELTLPKVRIAGSVRTAHDECRRYALDRSRRQRIQSRVKKIDDWPHSNLGYPSDPCSFGAKRVSSIYRSPFTARTAGRRGP